MKGRFRVMAQQCWLSAMSAPSLVRASKGSSSSYWKPCVGASVCTSSLGLSFVTIVSCCSSPGRCCQVLMALSVKASLSHHSQCRRRRHVLSVRHGGPAAADAASSSVSIAGGHKQDYRLLICEGHWTKPARERASARRQTGCRARPGRRSLTVPTASPPRRCQQHRARLSVNARVEQRRMLHVPSICRRMLCIC